MNQALLLDRSKIDMPNQWHAHLSLQLKKDARGTKLSRCRHKGPLYIQKPFYPEGPDCAHLYLLHPPGGIVSGDTLEVDIDLKDKASALVTTPGASRIYHARENQSEQKQITTCKLQKGAILEWLPMETIVYNGASVSLETTIHLSETSRLCTWEITSFGLPASKQSFKYGKFSQRYTIIKGNYPVFIDNIYIDGNNNASILTSNAGLQGKPICGFFLTGPFPDLSNNKHQLMLEGLRSEIACTNASAALSCIDDFVCIRYLGESTEQARKLFIHCWQALRPALLERPACLPRIWST